MLEPPQRNRKPEPPLDIQAMEEGIRAEHDSSPRSEETGASCTWCSRMEIRRSRADHETMVTNGPLFWDLFHGHCDCFLETDLLPSSTCGFCRHLNFKHLFKCTPTDDGDFESLKIWTDWYCKEGVVNECQFCRFVATEFQHEGISQILLSVVEDRLSLWAGDELQYSMTVRISAHPWPQLGDKVDWNRIRTRPSIASGERGDLPNEFRVIDVIRNCVVCPKDSVHYVALSYVWGRMSGNEFQATLSNIDQLEVEGSLSQIQLPRTIQDAMFACRQLGRRYLWVDRLCILQDDDNSKHGQIAHMDRIFGTAVFTIIALTGSDSQSGLAGVSTLRHIRFKTLVWPGFNLIEVPPQLKELVAKSTWNKRGWTFQEEFCSGNSLYFTDYGVYHSHSLPLRRSREIISECIDVPKREGLSISPNLNGLIEKYTTRIFAFPDDILRACTGALNRLTGDKHYFGAFFDEFEEGIHWQPLDWAHKRRTSSTETFPSWSWSSAHGPIEFQRSIASVSLWARPACPEPGKHEALQWLSHNRAVTALRYLAVEAGIVGTAEFPFNNPEGERERGFLGPSSLFVFGEHDRKRAHEKPGRILSFTQAATFSIRYLPYRFSDGCRTFSIRSMQNECVGGIRISAPSSEDVKGDDGVLREETFEFLALSHGIEAGVVKDIILGTGRDDHPSSPAAEIEEARLDWETIRNLYTISVMLIVRDEVSGVARRVGIGNVFKKAWLEARPELKVVVLE